MFIALEEAAQISAAENELRRTARNELPKTTPKSIGWQGGTIRGARVHHDDGYWSWSRNWPDEGTVDRYHNWFGRFDPDRSLDIGVEINVSRKGLNNSLGGLFARDTASGQVYLFHTGLVGGGIPGVGKTAFVGWFADSPVPVSTSHGLILGYPIVPVAGRNIIPALSRYLDSVAEFKQAARQGLTDTAAYRSRAQKFREYYSEPRGRRKGQRAPTFDYVTRHGEIVDAVAAWRESSGSLRGATIVKNTYIDVGVSRGDDLIELYEIKPGGDRQSIYTAMGQLFVHGANPKCRRRVLVVADDVRLPGDIAGALSKLDIEVLRVTLHDDGVTVLG